MTGRRDPSRSGRSTDIFTTHHNTALTIFQDACKLTNGHESTPSVTVATGRRDPSRSGRSAHTFTSHHLTRHHHDDPPIRSKLTHRDEPSQSVTDRHQFGDPLRIWCIGHPSFLEENIKINKILASQIES